MSEPFTPLRHDPQAGHPLIDGHTHIDQWDAPELETLLQRAGRANVGQIIAAGTTVSSCENGLALAAKHPFVKAGIGLHPADLEGPLDDEQRKRLLEIADRCPVHRTLSSEITIPTRLA